MAGGTKNHKKYFYTYVISNLQSRSPVNMLLDDYVSATMYATKTVAIARSVKAGFHDPGPLTQPGSSAVNISSQQRAILLNAI